MSGVGIGALIVTPTPPDPFEELRRYKPMSERAAIYPYTQQRNPAGQLLPRRYFLDRSFTFIRMTPELRSEIRRIESSGKAKLTDIMPLVRSDQGKEPPAVQVRFHHAPPPTWVEQKWTVIQNFLGF